MKINLTEEETLLLSRLVYNELLRQKYLLSVESITELPKEIISLEKKLKGDK